MSVPAATPTMTEAEARRITERIRYKALATRENLEGLQRLVQEAQEGQAHIVLGYKSWTAYLAEVLGSEPLRLPRDQRQQLVGYLAGEGMSTRAIAPIVGTSHDTVHRDLSGVRNLTPEPSINTETGEVSDDYPSTDVTTGGEVTPAAPAVTGQGAPAGKAPGERVEASPPLPPRRPVTGLDGKTYTRTIPRREPAPEPKRGTDLHALRYVVIPTLQAWHDEWTTKPLLDDTVTAEEAAQLLRDLSKSTPVLSQIRRLLNSRSGV